MPANEIMIRLPEGPKSLSIDSKWVDRRDELVKESQGIIVDDNTGFQAAAELQRSVTKHSNALEAIRKTMGRPFTDAASMIKKAADKARAPLEATKTELGLKTTAYMVKQRKIEEAERAAAEQKAREEAEKQAADAETAAELFGDESPQAQAPVEVQQEYVARRGVSSDLRLNERVEVESVDIERLPRCFCMADMVKINRYKQDNKDDIMAILKDNKDAEPIVGVRMKIENKSASR